MNNKKYFYIYIISIIIFLSINTLISFFSNFIIDDTIEDRLIKYQVSKIKNKDNYVENIFLGDSSLGNAINAEIFEKLSGKKTLNLALWGNTSFAGAFAILKNLELSKEQNIIIFSSLDVWSRPPDEFLYQLIISKFSIKNKLIFSVKNSFNYSLTKLRLNWYFNEEKHKEYLFNDYILQKNQILKKTNFQKIYYKKIKYLNKIFDFCYKKKINCLYVHGPIFEEHCLDDKSIDYINNIKIILQKNKIDSLNQIFCMKKEQLGDSDDHINPKFKDQFTKNFYKTLIENNIN